MSRYGRKRISRRDVLKAAGALAASVAALGGGAWLLQRMDDEQDRANASDSYTTNDHRTVAELKEITYKGKNYRQRPDLESYLFLGIDVMGPAVGTQSYVAGGQADTQILLVLDNAAKTWQLLQINRDSMVEVPVLSMMGTVAYTIKQQIALAHAYGNGREQSCENNVLAVSMLLDDQPIDGYFSLNMGGVGILVDLIGGGDADGDLGLFRHRPVPCGGGRPSPSTANRLSSMFASARTWTTRQTWPVWLGSGSSSLRLKKR